MWLIDQKFLRKTHNKLATNATSQLCYITTKSVLGRLQNVDVMCSSKLFRHLRWRPSELGRRWSGVEPVLWCALQVSVMQQELQNLQPELIKTSANTEKLMVKIEQDTVEVEAKREVHTTLHTQTNKVRNSPSDRWFVWSSCWLEEHFWRDFSLDVTAFFFFSGVRH